MLPSQSAAIRRNQGRTDTPSPAGGRVCACILRPSSTRALRNANPESMDGSISVESALEGLRSSHVWAGLMLVGLFALSGCASHASRPNTPPLAVIAAAGHGNPIAQYQVGRIALARSRTASQRANGLAWIRLAADRNLAMAQYYLGTAYMRGRNVPQNTPLALRWIRRAAEHGAPAAQLELGDLYEAGNIIPLDNARAYFWFSVLAKPAHSSITIYNIGRLRAIARDHLANVSPALTRTQRLALDRRIAAWKPEPGPPYNGIVPLGNDGD